MGGIGGRGRLEEPVGGIDGKGGGGGGGGAGRRGRWEGLGGSR